MKQISSNNETLRVQGEINFKNVMNLLQDGLALMEQVGRSLPIIYIDLSSVTKVDNVALALLAAWSRDALQKNKKVIYRNLPVALKNMAKVFGVDFLFEEQPMSELPLNS